MNQIYTPAPSRVRKGGSTAYLVHSPVHGLLGLVGNVHTTRSPSAITLRTTWWAERRDGPHSEPTATAEDLPSRDTAVSWLRARALPSAPRLESADERFTAHVEALAVDAGHSAAWSAASQAVYLRLHELLAQRYAEARPRALWREVIQMIAWFDATTPARTMPEVGDAARYET